MSTNIFNRLPQFFFNEAPNDGNKYIRILGRENSQRVYKYIRSDYVNQPKNLFQYKIFYQAQMEMVFLEKRLLHLY